MYVVPLIIFVILTLFSPWIDWHLTKLVYDQSGQFYNNDFLRFLFTYGTWPAWAAAFLSLIPFIFKRLRSYRKTALLFLLTFIVGTGLIVNGLLKEFWPRPRPIQVTDFGGSQAFRPFFDPLYKGVAYKSFPSGHAAAGFVFFALFWAGITTRNKALKIIGLVLGLSLGILLSTMRILMGGHFFYDTLFSAALMWFLPPFFLKVLRWKN